MCFQSSDHLFPHLMSSVINKCMALISLCVVGALELVWSCGDGGSMPEFFWRWWSGHGEVAFEQMLSSLFAGRGSHISLLSSKSIKLLLTELSLPGAGAYIRQWAKHRCLCETKNNDIVLFWGNFRMWKAKWMVQLFPKLFICKCTLPFVPLQWNGSLQWTTVSCVVILSPYSN